MTDPKLDSEMVEAVARAIVAELGRQDDGDEWSLGDDLKLAYLDQGEVDFALVAQAALSVIQPRIEKLERERERMRDHLREQITFAESRIQDGIEMGATVWRIALEDIVSENLAALQSEAGD